MLSVYLQIGIPCLAVFLILLVVSIVRKRASLPRVTLLAALALVGAACLTLGILSSDHGNAAARGDQEALDRYFAAAFAANGSYREAGDILERTVKNGEQPEDVLLLARLAVLEEDYTKAQLYYRKYLGGSAPSDDASEEAAYVSALAGTGYRAADNAIVRQYMEEHGLTESDLGLTEEGKAAAIPTAADGQSSREGASARPLSAGGTQPDAADTLRRRVQEAVEEIAESRLDALGEIGDDARRCVKHLMAVNASLEQYMVDFSVGEDLEDAAKRLNRLVSEESALSCNETVRNGALVANALLGDGASIAENIDENATVEEIMVATELYISGSVEPGAFKGLGKAPRSSTVRSIYRQCSAVIDSNHDKWESAEEEQYQYMAQQVRRSGDNYEVRQMLSVLTERAGSLDEGEKSQTYLQMAKGFGYMEAETELDTYIDLALENAAGADDAEYAAAMAKLLSVIQGADEEGLRYISTYVGDALDHLIPVPMEQLIRTGSNTRSRSSDTEGEGYDFVSRLTEKVSQKRSTINIGKIDISEFPTVSTRLSFGSGAGITGSNIKEKFTLYDCGYPIRDFEAEKIKSLNGKIVLVCDMSGSMSGSVQQLKDALIGFADGMTENEEIAVIGFSGGIEFQTGFMSDPAEVRACADRLHASGGTAMYPAVRAAADLFTDGIDDDNIIIVMTDGQDGARPGSAELASGIRGMVEEHGCTIYTLGLGGVETSYLTTIAELGNGQFLYVESADSLSSFYEFIHAQLSNQYRIRYTAEDTILNNRTLEVDLKDSISNATKRYVLREGEEEETTPPEQNVEVRQVGDLSIAGFSEKGIYRGRSPVTVTLNGKGFQDGANYELRLECGLKSYTLEYAYVSETQLAVTVPGDLPVATCDLHMIAEGKQLKISNALQIWQQMNMKGFRYGSYTFTCDRVTALPDGLRLSGNVIMNGWLYFTGDVTFTGDVRDGASKYIRITAPSARIEYSTRNSTGFAKWMAERGLSIPLPTLGTFEIYNDRYDQNNYKDFSVRKFTLNAPFKLKSIANIGGTVALYPDMVYAEAFYADLDLPFMKNLMKNLPKEVFSKEVTGALALTDQAVCLNASVSVQYNSDNDKTKKFQFGKMDFRIKELGFELDTIKEEYKVDLEVAFEAFKIKKIAEVDGFGLELGWTGEGFDSFKLSGSGERKLCSQPVPLYLRGLSIGAENLSGIKKLGDILNATVKGGFDLTTSDVIKHVPKAVKEFFDMDELYLAELDEAEIAVTLGEFNINFKSNLKVLSFQLAECEINVGKFDYKNEILGIYDDEYGVDAALTVGIDREWKNLEINANGYADVTLGYPFSGLTLKGNLGYDLRWFLFSFGKELYGDFGVGLYWNSSGEPQFMIQARGEKSNGKYTGFRVDISPSMGTQKVKL